MNNVMIHDDIYKKIFYAIYLYTYNRNFYMLINL